MDISTSSKNHKVETFGIFGKWKLKTTSPSELWAFPILQICGNKNLQTPCPMSHGAPEKQTTGILFLEKQITGSRKDPRKVPCVPEKDHKKKRIKTDINLIILQ